MIAAQYSLSSRLDRASNFGPAKLMSCSLSTSTAVAFDEKVKYAQEKYNSAGYEQIARILWQFSGDGLADTQQFARRLLANILLENGDAHLKNWSLVYRDNSDSSIVTRVRYRHDKRLF